MDHIYDTAKRIMLDPHPLVPMAEYFDHVLGTAGFAYGLASFEDLIERAVATESLNTRYLSALERIKEFGTIRHELSPEAQIARAALAPDAGTEDGAVSSEGGTE